MKVILFCVFAIGQVINTNSTNDPELTFLLNYLEVTKQNLLETISEVSATEWRKKDNSGEWSPAQCVKHIIDAERAVFQQITEQVMSQLSETEEMDLVKFDAWLIGKVNDRGIKVKTPLNKEPDEISQKEAAAIFSQLRDQTIDFLKRNKKPLRRYIGQSPYGPADAYQLFLVMAAHTMRHQSQINEILDRSVPGTFK